MRKDYYLILGVPPDAAPRAIREAFRRAALRHHPDRRADGDADTFRQASEAYDVLSDPRRRARYDEQSGRGVVVRRGGDAKRPARPAVEPLDSGPVRVGAAPERVRPSWNALLARFSRNFAGDLAPKFEHAEPLTYELILSPEEARRGVRIPFEIPVFTLCPSCRGSGRDPLFRCVRCRGEGRLVERGVARLVVPPGVRDGTVVERSLARLGVRNLWLRVLVRVTRGGV